MYYTVMAKPINYKRFRVVEFARDGLYIVSRVIHASVFSEKQLNNLKDHLKTIHDDSQISFKIRDQLGKVIWSI